MASRSSRHRRERFIGKNLVGAPAARWAFEVGRSTAPSPAGRAAQRACARPTWCSTSPASTGRRHARSSRRQRRPHARPARRPRVAASGRHASPVVLRLVDPGGRSTALRHSKRRPRRAARGLAARRRRRWRSIGCRTCSASGAGPNYNSVVATFCHNIARDLPITVDDPAAPLSWSTSTTWSTTFVGASTSAPASGGFDEVEPVVSDHGGRAGAT